MKFMIEKGSKPLFVYLALGKGETYNKRSLEILAKISFSILPKHI